MKEQIIEIISDLIPDFDYEEGTLLLEDGILDSFDIVNLVLELNEEFGINIGVEDVTEENFNTVEAIQNLIEEKLEG